MSARRKKLSLLKIRHTWQIKPHTRVKPSDKIYRRPQQKKKSWTDDIGWFGEL